MKGLTWVFEASEFLVTLLHAAETLRASHGTFRGLCVRVFVSGSLVKQAKPDERIEMPFGKRDGQTRVGPIAETLLRHTVVR